MARRDWDCIQRERSAVKKWHTERNEESRQEYRREVTVEVAKANKGLRLDSKEGETELYRLARQRERWEGCAAG